MKTVLVTGSTGLIGSEVSSYFLALGFKVVGIDNNMRMTFFGKNGDTTQVKVALLKNDRYVHYDHDIRNSSSISDVFKRHKPTYVVHAAAQPSHDLAASLPVDDFHINAVGTLNILEACRQHVPESPVVFVSTNKVYGDTPNKIKLIEHPTRYDYADPAYARGVNESMSIDQTLHSLFGVSKTSADLLAQEYGRYFNLPVGIFRGGCLTGPRHAGAELHGFLSYIVKCAVNKIPYTIYGYKGKQVRDQIHSFDVCTAFHEFLKSPRPGEVYNIGGERENSASILEIIKKLDDYGHSLKHSIVDRPRRGDHICYMTDMSKFKSHYPEWKKTKGLNTTIQEIVRSHAS